MSLVLQYEDEKQSDGNYKVRWVFQLRMVFQTQVPISLVIA